MKLKQIAVRINPQVDKEVEAYCKHNGTVKRAFIELALIAELDKKGRYEPKK